MTGVCTESTDAEIGSGADWTWASGITSALACAKKSLSFAARSDTASLAATCAASSFGCASVASTAFVLALYSRYAFSIAACNSVDDTQCPVP